ncbi:filamentous hemagglutinin N-terminal domain-containing protein, partial [Crocosphaera sp.]|uniref:filamentous hemagglutinin N-terminal domain-containing protein n=1 Tax=Crocosphaera sp. TaxID=2729996 RepID=UPI003F263F0A
MQKFPSFLTHLGLSLATAITLLTDNSIVLGQAIQSDNTLSNSGFTDSVVNQIGNNYTITGGTDIGGNLFHSFLEFSVPNFGRAFFNNNLGIENIISRVTGSNISTIEGVIQANGAANLFLINPNGITIGPNAGLDIGGSFVASTADSIEFLGGGRFSAKNPDGNGTLLTMTAPLGLQMGTNPGQITVEGFGNNLVLDPDTFEIIDLPVPPNLPPFIPPEIFVLKPFAVSTGETLALVGGDIVFEGGNVAAAQGRVELAAFSNGLVNFTTVNGQLQITPPTGGITYEDISLSGGSSVDVSGDSSGSVQVQGQNLILNSGSVILANTTGNGSGGEITVTTTDSIEANGIGVLPPTLNPSGAFSHEIFSGIFAHTSSQSTPNAQGGSIRLNTGQLRVTDGAQIGANTYGP